MVAVDLYGVAAVVAAVGSTFTTALAVWLTRPIRDTHRQVKPSNGNTTAANVEAIADRVGAHPADSGTPGA